jgi:hypothetical protein
MIFKRESMISLVLALECEIIGVELRTDLEASEIIDCYLALSQCCGSLDWSGMDPDMAYEISSRCFHLIGALTLRAPLQDKLKHCA